MSVARSTAVVGGCCVFIRSVVIGSSRSRRCGHVEKWLCASGRVLSGWVCPVDEASLFRAWLCSSMNPLGVAHSGSRVLHKPRVIPERSEESYPQHVHPWGWRMRISRRNRFFAPKCRKLGCYTQVYSQVPSTSVDILGTVGACGANGT